ncbi:MAG: protein translocase subunit SecF [Acidimicrobiia bacterium]|nr:protein translocase subunit SecF [Acidimicrobiia bacterium]
MGLGRRLYDGDTRFRFMRVWKRAAVASALVILVGLASLGIRGLNLGIDFEGGVSWELPSGGVGVEEIRDGIEDLGLGDATIQTLTAGGEERVRVRAETDATADDAAVSDRLAEITGSSRDDVSFNEVGPSWGQEITDKAVRALVVFLVLITVYVSLRFEFKMALAILVGLLHDLLVTVGVYSVSGLEVTPATVVSILTILGYSIYDGIVVFDKVDENTRLVSSTKGITYSDMMDLSLNQTLMRSLNTTIVAVIPIASLLIIGSLVLGATTLQEFAFALLVGLLSGAYSSLFIASPLLAVLKEREPRYADVRRRITARTGARTPAPADPVDVVDEPTAAASPTGTTTTTTTTPRPTGVIPPRPRKKRR